MKSKRILSVVITAIADPEIIEPVLLDEAKTWLVVEHDEHDGLITELITAVRKLLEKRTKKVFVPSTAVVQLLTPGSFDIPRMPVKTFTKFEIWCNGAYQEVTNPCDYRIVGENFYTNLAGQKRLTYAAGYDTDDFPEDLKLAMKSEICYRYENRGDKTLNADLSSTTESYISNYISYAWQ